VPGFERLCRDRGLRPTAQRRAVYEALRADKGHPTAEALWLRLRLGMPSLSHATVYRILESFIEGGLARRVHSPGGAARFDGHAGPHHHLECRLCGAIADWDGPLAMPRLPAPPGGFRVEEAEVRFVGLCPRCRRRSMGRQVRGARARASREDDLRQ
jgi:Fe2+ or Zn2+ uptake regulation protein